MRRIAYCQIKDLSEIFLTLFSIIYFTLDGSLETCMGFGLFRVCHFFGSVENGQCDSRLCGWEPWRPGGLGGLEALGVLVTRRPGGLGGLEALEAWRPWRPGDLGGLEALEAWKPWRPGGLRTLEALKPWRP